MRRLLRIFKWMGLGLSTLLFLATVVLWVRSRGDEECWQHTTYEPLYSWSPRRISEDGSWRFWWIKSCYGRLRLGFNRQPSSAPIVPDWPTTNTNAVRLVIFTEGWQHSRTDLSRDEEAREFDFDFRPGWDADNYRNFCRSAWRFGGAGYRAEGSRYPPYSFCLKECAIPLWMLATVFGLSPLLYVAMHGLRVLRLLGRKRFAKGLCQKCGYDLRATPERCPECGQEVVAKPK